MSEPRNFNGLDFIEHDWQPEEISEESSYAYNRWRVEQQRLQIAEEAKAQERFDGMSLDQITAEYRQKVAEEEAAKRPQQFMSERPDYVACPANGNRIEQYIEAARLDSTNPDHVHQAARALESRGLLKLDPSKIEVRPRQKYSEEDLYEMPFDQLEKLARKSGL
jgi:hypothetical protein